MAFKEVRMACGNFACRAHSFKEFIAPLAPDQFYSEFLGEKPFHLRGDQDRFSNLLTEESINRLVTSQAGNPTFRVYKDGCEVPKDKYLTMQRSWLAQLSLVDTGALSQELGKGATIVLNSLEQRHAPVSAMCRVLAEALGGYIDVVAFAAWQPNQAFNTHWDHEDVFIAQVSGRKHWRLFPHERRHPTVKDFTSEFKPPTESPYWEGDLNAGDLLYIPSGWWHDAVANAGPTVHVSFGCDLPTGLDLGQQLVDRLREYESVRALLPRHRSEGDRQHYMSAFRRAVQEVAEQISLDDFLRERDAMAPARGRLSLPWSATPSSTLPWSASAPRPESLSVPPRAWIHWLAPRSVPLAHSEGQVTVDAIGYRFIFDDVAGPVLQDLMKSRRIQFAALRDRHAQPFIEGLTAQLVSWGLIAISEDEVI